jgi:hypothetical protein
LLIAKSFIKQVERLLVFLLGIVWRAQPKTIANSAAAAAFDRRSSREYYHFTQVHTRKPSIDTTATTQCRRSHKQATMPNKATQDATFDESDVDMNHEEQNAGLQRTDVWGATKQHQEARRRYHHAVALLEDLNEEISRVSGHAAAVEAEANAKATMAHQRLDAQRLCDESDVTAKHPQHLPLPAHIVQHELDGIVSELAAMASNRDSGAHDQNLSQLHELSAQLSEHRVGRSETVELDVICVSCSLLGDFSASSGEVHMMDGPASPAGIEIVASSELRVVDVLAICNQRWGFSDGSHAASERQVEKERGETRRGFTSR